MADLCAWHTSLSSLSLVVVLFCVDPLPIPWWCLCPCHRPQTGHLSELQWDTCCWTQRLNYTSHVQWHQLDNASCLFQALGLLWRAFHLFPLVPWDWLQVSSGTKMPRISTFISWRKSFIKNKGLFTWSPKVVLNCWLEAIVILTNCHDNYFYGWIWYLKMIYRDKNGFYFKG